MSEFPSDGMYVSNSYDSMLIVVHNGIAYVLGTDGEGGNPTLVRHPAHHVTQTWHGVPAQVVPADAIVIERSALPEVRDDQNFPYVVAPDLCVGPILDEGETVEGLRAYGLACLALAEYGAAHPPVDEAQVEAMTADLEMTDPVSDTYGAQARSLIARGWHKDADR